MHRYRNSVTDEAKTYKSEKEKNEKEKPLRSEFNPVPMYRAYGVTKREYRVWEIIKQILMKGTTLLFLLALIAYPIIGVTTFIIFGNALVSFLLSTTILVLMLLKLTRTIRKRAKFHCKLKRFCKKNKYRIKFEQNFFESLVWSPVLIDFTLTTGTHNYIVHYFTAHKYNSSLSFLEKGKMVFKKYPPNNKFTVIFDFKAKSKEYEISFPKEYELDRKINVNALVVNPVCKEFFEREQGGGIVPTGNGACVFGIQVFTGSGFIETVKRNDRSDDINYIH